MLRNEIYLPSGKKVLDEIYLPSGKKVLGEIYLPSGKKSGDNSEEDTPVPISNTEAKLFCADGTWWATAWESKSLLVE